LTFSATRIYLYAAARVAAVLNEARTLSHSFSSPDAMKSRSKLFRLALLATALSLSLALPPARRSDARQSEALGRGAVGVRVEGGKELKLYEQSYALVVGVSDYTRGWPNLPGVKKDVEEVARALERHGFLVTKVENPDSAQLDKSFREFIDAYGRGVETRLLFYFAGHGHTVRQSYGEEMGYIVPTDAPLPARDPAGFMSKAMDMQQMEIYARRVQSKHALFVFDSCFSGAIFALSRAVPDAISYKTARPVRQFITSGSANEQVPDQSIFRHQFVEALDGEADVNKDGYVTGTELGEFLQDKVINYSRSAQHPQYGKIRNPNLDKGDFVFALPKAPKPPLAVAGATPTPAPPTGVAPIAVELAFWDSVKNSSDPADFREYLKKYPAGQFAGIAQRRLSALAAAALTKPTAGAVVRTRSGIDLVYVPPGSFTMGSEKQDKPDERPVHRVTIREGFWMGRYEVTQTQWQAVMGNNPSHFKGCDDCPIEQVSWYDARGFVQKLNAQNDGFIYRLPTEAEWEYASRATTTGAHAGNPDSMGWYKDNADGRTHPVGQKQPNGFGLYDMYGNVWEHVQDHYRESYKDAPTDGSAWEGSEATASRVGRGGSWDNDKAECDSTSRSSDEPGVVTKLIGFRLAAVARH
jgi:formylglycine-generating enzyme required for sulfatase activity